MKILTIVGARPQFIKAAVVSRALRRRKNCHELLVHTGQHYDANMSEVFFKEMAIPKPAYYLGIGSGSHGQQTGRMLEAIERVLQAEKPDWVLVYGDTNSTVAGALAASKLHMPVAHVEAGLRSFNRRMPEEINRVLTDHIADVLYAPTQMAVQNLRNEGIAINKIVRSGDVMLDASLYYRQQRGRAEVARALALPAKGYILATLHRAENTETPQRMAAALAGLALAGKKLKMPVVLPLHPRTRHRLAKHMGSKKWLTALTVIEPVGFFDMLELEANAAVIATDSGGVQKEAYFFQVPCVTLRDETEWVELVQCGWNRLAPPTSAANVAKAIITATGSKGKKTKLYGNGKAGEQIVSNLLNR